MHCGRYLRAPLTRREMLVALRQRLRRAGPGRALGDRAFGGTGATDLTANPLGAAGRRTSRRKAEERHLPVHGRRAVAGRHVRPQAAARPRARPADQDEGRADAVQQRRQRAQVARGSSASTARAASRSATCSRTSPAASTTWRSSARWSSNFSEHTNANYFLHTGTGLQGRPEHGRVGHLRPGQRVPEPARLRRPQRRPDPARRARLLQQRLPAGRVSGLALQAPATQPGRQPRAAERDARRCSAASSTCCARSTAASLDRIGHDDALEVGHRQLRAGLPHADGRARADRPRGRDRRRRSKLYGLDDPTDRRSSAGSACSPGGWSSAACGSSSCSARTSAHDRWDQHSNLKEGHENNARAVDQPIAGLLQGPEGARPARRHAGRLGRRVRPHADGPGHRRPRPQPVRLHHVAGRRRRQGRHRPRRDRRLRLPRRRGQGRRSTTCTPRCCTCSASTTSG